VCHETRRQAIEVALRGPRSKKMVLDCVDERKCPSRISIGGLHLAIVQKTRPIPVSVIRKLINAESLSSIMIYEIILRYYDVYRPYLDDIIVYAEAGRLDLDSQTELVRQARCAQDVTSIRNAISRIVAKEKSS
jgi:hypothetical protein